MTCIVSLIFYSCPIILTSGDGNWLFSLLVYTFLRHLFQVCDVYLILSLPSQPLLKMLHFN